MTEEQKKKLENEAKSWLQIKINEVAIRKSCSLNPELPFVFFFLKNLILLLILGLVAYTDNGQVD